MAKKKLRPQKPGGAAAIETIEDDLEHETVLSTHEANGSQSHPSAGLAKSKRTTKPKADQASDEPIGITDIKKGAAFVNSMGGLEKAIAILQILKVAKEVQ